MTRILIVADGRSPITRRWLALLSGMPYQVGLVSTFPCEPPENLDFFAVIPVAFSRVSASRSGSAANPNGNTLRRLVGRFRGLLLAGRYTFGPLSVRNAGPAFNRQLQEYKPDLVHALRIPFEGMLASQLPADIPFLVSIWGNDLTLHAAGSPAMAALTRVCLRRADGLMADARRDLRLGRQWGLRTEAPGLVVPGSGGLDLSEMDACRGDVADLFSTPLPADVQIVINPRGFRPGSVRNDTFFSAAPGLLRQSPRAVIVCPSMAGQPLAERWLEEMRAAGLADRIFLLPTLPQKRLWDLFHRAEVFVSPSAHDGTPNSLLEAMACGCFPVTGDIESLREWITPGVNGLLVDPGRPGELAAAISLALSRPELRAQASVENAGLVAQRANRAVARDQVAEFYERAIRLADAQTEISPASSVV